MGTQLGLGVFEEVLLGLRRVSSGVLGEGKVQGTGAGKGIAKGTE